MNEVNTKIVRSRMFYLFVFVFGMWAGSCWTNLGEQSSIKVIDKLKRESAVQGAKYRQDMRAAEEAQRGLKEVIAGYQNRLATAETENRELKKLYTGLVSTVGTIQGVIGSAGSNITVIGAGIERCESIAAASGKLLDGLTTGLRSVPDLGRGTTGKSD